MRCEVGLAFCLLHEVRSSSWLCVLGLSPLHVWGANDRMIYSRHCFLLIFLKFSLSFSLSVFLPPFRYEDDVPLSICLEFPLNNRGPPPKAVTSQEKGRGGKGGAVTKSYGKVDQADKMLAVPDDVGGDGGEIGIAKKRHSMREALADRFIETLSLDRSAQR